MDRIIKNRFAKSCHASFCGEKVAVGEGYAICVNNNWATYHEKCLPEEAKAKLAEAPKPEEPKKFVNQKGEIFFPYNPAIIQAVKCIPGRSWNGQKKCWTIPVEANSMTIALPIFDSFEIAYPEEFKVLAQSEFEDEVAEEVTVYNASKLYDYQIEGAKFLSTHRRALLGDEMGTGKTIQALAAIPANSRILIVAPACVKFNWAKEAAKWRPEFTSLVVQGKDNFVLPQKNQIVICNRELLPDYLANKNSDAPLNLDKEILDSLRELLVIIDEAHYFKGTKTGCYKKLKNITKHAKKVWALTGTPLTSRPMDLWGVLSACDMENIVFGNSSQKPFGFFASCFQAYKGKYGLIWGDPLPEVPNLLSKVHICRKRKDVLPQLPPKVYTDLEVDIGHGRGGAKIKRKLDNLHSLYGNAFAVGKLPPFEEFAEVRADLALSRVDAMLEYIDDCEENEVPLVVFSAHVKPFDVLRGRTGWAIIDGSTKAEDRQKIVEAFQNGLLQGVACTIQAGGVGITLTRAWKALFIDQDWVPANNWQAEDRICRMGQKSDRVEIVRLVSSHPLDRRLLELLGNKADLIDKTFN